MMNNNISGLRIDLQDPSITERVALTLKKYHPKDMDLVNYAWIPQTICDQIWVLYEFINVDAKEKWEKGLPEQVKNWISPEVIPFALEYGWFVRDLNGFIQ